MPNYSHFITYGITALIILIIISLVIGRYKNSYGRKERELHGQIRSLFRPYETLTVYEVKDRFRKYSKSRQNLSDERVCQILDGLVASHKLNRSIVPVKTEDLTEINKVTYSLP